MIDTTNRRWQVGDVTLTALVEAEVHGVPVQIFFPDATPDEVRSCEWLGTYARSDGTVGLTVQAFLLQMPSLTVLVDPCVGNGRKRVNPFWHDQHFPWLDRVHATGIGPEAIDLVLHTHLHADHVGWDTHRVGEAWVPTFPNARYVYVGDELDYWRAAEQRTNEDVYGDSVAPVIDRDMADVVDAHAKVADGLQFVPTPGHTPGHVSLEVTTGDEPLVITGDLIHHPAQFAYPHWSEIADYDVSQARATRRGFVDAHAASGTLLAGTHFPAQPVGRAVSEGAVWRFEPVAPA